MRMKKFLINTLLFSVITIIAFLLLHWYSQNLPNDYTFKRERIEENASSIKILNIWETLRLCILSILNISQKEGLILHTFRKP